MTGQLLEESISFLKKRQLIKQLVAAKNPSPTRFDCKRQLSVLDSKTIFFSCGRKMYFYLNSPQSAVVFADDLVVMVNSFECS